MLRATRVGVDRVEQRSLDAYESRCPFHAGLQATGIPMNKSAVMQRELIRFPKRARCRLSGFRSVRRLTFLDQLIDCTHIGALLDFVSAHGKPVLCRYAPNPR